MKKSTIQIISLTISVLILQIFIPVVKFINLDIIADILIIFLTYIGLYYGRFYTIILGFVFGIIQDMITQIDLMGAMALTKSIIGYGLGTLALYKNIWSIQYRLLFILLIYFCHFITFYFFKFNGIAISLPIIFQIIVIHSILSFLILLIVDKTFFSNGVTTR